MELNWLREERDGVVLTVKAVPRARANGVAGIEGDWLRVHLQAPPVDGKANAALCEFFASLFRCPKSSVSVVSGMTAKNKIVEVAGTGASAARSAVCANCK